MLNASDGGGGAAKAAFRLNRGMRELGINSRLLVQSKTADVQGVVCNATPVGKMVQALRPHFDLLPVRFYRNKPLLNFSPAWLPDRVAGQVAAMKPDLIHLHWLTAGFVRLETLKKLNRLNKPLVWTLHDSWAFTGGCHVPFECTEYRQKCGRCPVLGSAVESDLSRWIWKRKRKAWQDLEMTIVTPSRWLADCARASSLFRGRRVEVIPNGLDLQVFKPINKQLARELLGLPQDRKLILFGGAGINLLANKGFHLLRSALQSLAKTASGEEPELVVFGASDSEDGQGSGFKANYLGWLHDEPSLVAAYSAADVFVAPSMLENFPNTVLEAMACGTPCVAFAQGGMPQLVDHERTGYLAQPYEVDDLMAGIRLVLENDELRSEMARNARQKVEENFALDKVCKSYIALYRELAECPA
jgi:glycosyltransferase involved in cell wall biosynthesis